MDTQKEFWNEWADNYLNFSETIKPYIYAQKAFANVSINALGNDITKDEITVIDVGGGAGNMIGPFLEELSLRRANLNKVTYNLTDGSESMLFLANQRLLEMKKKYPDTVFNTIFADTLSERFSEKLAEIKADLIIYSWNIEYYNADVRLKILQKLKRHLKERGILSFSSIMKLPENLSIKDVLIPLGAAQVVHELLTGGPVKMRRVIFALKQIAAFGEAAADKNFPGKPNLEELKDMAKLAGFNNISAGYHLHGASGMVLTSEGTVLPELPKTTISALLSGKEGYDGHDQTVSFWSYLRKLFRKKV